MLIYNHKKEFVGIDNGDLQTLGFRDMQQLLVEVGDFADLFVRTPGHIHNFKHVHWIDYVMVDGSSEHSKVVINANKHLYRADLQISVAYLVDEPSQEAYFVSLHGLRMLTQDESSSISQMPTSVLEPTTLPQQEQHQDYPQSEAALFNQQDEISEPSVQSKTQIQPEPAVFEEPFPLEDEDLFVDNATITPDEEVPFEQPATQTQQTSKAQEFVANSTYVYDPQIASDELGLPLDLIEEFIEDFIAQAREFKPQIYSALDENDADKVKTLSHKLKGVAANLRIEDAFDVLTVVNTTSDLGVARENLDIFYLIIEKLAGNEIAPAAPSLEAQEVAQQVKQEKEPQPVQEDNDEMILEFKDDTQEPAPYLDINDEDVPEQIELAELADDDFVLEDIHNDEATIEDDLLKVEDDIEEPIIQEPKLSLEYSHEQAAAEIGLDIESFEELLSDYAQESEELVGTIKTALQNDDLQLVHKLAHQLKGMSRNMRLENIAAQAESIEKSENVDTIRQTLESVEALIQKIS